VANRVPGPYRRNIRPRRLAEKGGLTSPTVHIRILRASRADERCVTTPEAGRCLTPRLSHARFLILSVSDTAFPVGLEQMRCQTPSSFETEPGSPRGVRHQARRLSRRGGMHSEQITTG